MNEGGTPDGKATSDKSGSPASTDGSSDEHAGKQIDDDTTKPDTNQEDSSSAEASTSEASTSKLLPVGDDTIAKLSEAFIESIQPHFEHSKESLEELIRNQELLLETVQQENRKYEENQMLEEINERMKKARLYQTKLVNIRKEMVNLHDKVGKLKKRALKLQSQRMKTNLQREQQKEREYEEDRLLRARPAAADHTTDGPTGPPP